VKHVFKADLPVAAAAGARSGFSGRSAWPTGVFSTDLRKPVGTSGRTML